MPAGRRVFLHHVRAGDVRRHQVGRELHAAELHRQRVRQRPGHQRLAQSGHAVQQHVPAAEQAHQQEVDDLVLADDDPADFLLDPLAGVGEPANGRGVVVRGLAVRFDQGHGAWFGGRHVGSFSESQ